MPIITRAEWGSMKGGALSALTVSTVTIHWGGGPLGALDHSKCAGVVRSYQAYHINGQGWADIAYNLLVCQHGYIFEGRGLGKRSAANGDGPSNSASYAICFIGGTGDPFTGAAKDAINDAAELLVPGSRTWKLHGDWVGTDCPGSVIRTWVLAGHPRASAAPAPPAPTSTEDTLFSKSPVPSAHIVPTHSRLLLTAEAKRHGSVTQEPANGALGQRWMLYGHDDGSVSLVSREVDVASGRNLALDVENNEGTPGITLQVFPFDAGPAQRFTVAAGGSGPIVHTSSGLVLDVLYASTSPGGVLGLYTAHGGANQQFMGLPTS